MIKEITPCNYELVVLHNDNEYHRYDSGCWKEVIHDSVLDVFDDKELEALYQAYKRGLK